ncbi:MAG TPA: phosphate ABC transporter permease subunit PstC [Syntrophorhabdaceae bacterium]|jgi:phosphate ABC transporter permease protein PstC|nr:MAG: Phosphate transport system permease protein PstC [Deltaproteobacteria bacterium ADurb.Bin026]HOF58065.1 phosphate ABC transporter permease subunit PstC [Syntrophorhabdaceae bacterium]HOS06075.1 phosphate ABC transporter permease subunit PstC [Syntrophorhabdaceae bacterium]HPH41436.1 phosphate ABC transporter permease subunit PstC [Syntrophorhabdaceae bacterium]HPL41247.1 phosphate ABC transporter permease subunit PstC [Syntrophorhabdaceae bacterium]
MIKKYRFNKEHLVRAILTVFALSSLLFLFLIFIFILFEGLPLFLKIGLNKIILGFKWAPTKDSFGIFPMVVSSFLVTFGALVIGAPLGLSCAIYLSEYSGKKTKMFLKPALELLAGIPSVVYGFLGVIYIVPLVRNYLGGSGFSLLSTSIVLGVMILPTIISISFDAIVSVPKTYREGSFAMGATKWQTIYKVIIPSAKSGILASFILGMGRAIGETMAVIMIAGNALKIPTSILDPLRTLTGNIALELAYATGDHRLSLFSTGVVLLVIIMILNYIANFGIKRKVLK